MGKEEQHEREEAGTEVINHFASTEIGISRNMNNRWSLALFVPVINNARSSMYEHYGNTSKSPNARRSTHSFGLGDARIAAYYWLLNPTKSSKGNVQLGLGIKLPTGVSDKIRTTKTGVYAQGDAAFSDYTINFGVSFSLK